MRAKAETSQATSRWIVCVELCLVVGATGVLVNCSRDVSLASQQGALSGSGSSMPPKCLTDADCGSGYRCDTGTCNALPVDTEPDDGGEWWFARDEDGNPLSPSDAFESEESEDVEALGMYMNDDSGGPGYVTWIEDPDELHTTEYEGELVSWTGHVGFTQYEGWQEDPGTGLRNATVSPFVAAGGQGPVLQRPRASQTCPRSIAGVPHPEIQEVLREANALIGIRARMATQTTGAVLNWALGRSLNPALGPLSPTLGLAQALYRDRVSANIRRRHNIVSNLHLIQVAARYQAGELATACSCRTFYWLTRNSSMWTRARQACPDNTIDHPGACTRHTPEQRARWYYQAPPLDGNGGGWRRLPAIAATWTCDGTCNDALPANNRCANDMFNPFRP